MYKYNNKVDNKDVTFVGYFIVEVFKEERFFNLTYKLTQIFDPITYLESGDMSNSKEFVIRNINKDRMFPGIIIPLELSE